MGSSSGCDAGLKLILMKGRGGVHAMPYSLSIVIVYCLMGRMFVSFKWALGFNDGDRGGGGFCILSNTS